MACGDSVLEIAEGFAVHKVKVTVCWFGSSFFTKTRTVQIKLINSSNDLVYTILSCLIVTEI